MVENKKVEFSLNELEKLISQGKKPKDLNKFKITINQIIEAQKLKQNGASPNEILSLFSENTNIDEVENGLAFYKFILENKNFFKEVINTKGKSSKFRQSGHLVDQSLKYKDPFKRQPTLFDIISPETVEKIEPTQIEIKAEGIRLSPSEDKLLKALSKLLQDKSENGNMEADDFYSSNTSDYQICQYGGKGQTAKSPILRISPSEIYKAYLDRDNYSGEEIKFIKKTLYEFSNKKFLIVYDRKRKENGKNVTDRIEDYQSLIKIMTYTEGLSDSELDKLDSGDMEIRERKGELIIGLNPIFTDQISTKYIEFPSDINKRTTIAAGGHHRVTESMIALRDYMLREISSKRFRVEINDEKLPYILHLDKYILGRRKKLVLERITTAIGVVKNLGIVADVQQVTGASGQLKHVFLLNEDFE